LSHSFSPFHHFTARLAPALFFGAALSAEAQPAASSSLGQLKLLSLDQLTRVEVTSVSRRSEKLVDAAAAIQVLTGDRIIRSGAMTLPDALRLATGVQVSQLDGREWAVSARGFASLSSEKMEVSMDGRSLYGPLFSGVLWDVQSAVFEDLDRIEVVRGPGAALWGANAVNGVINLVTKPASETQGSYLDSTLGVRERQAIARYGGTLGDTGFFRVYAHAWGTDGLQLANGASAGDDRRMLKAGGRADFALGLDGKLTLQSDVYRGLIGQLNLPQSTVQGGNGIARYESADLGGRKFRVQANYDHSERNIPRTYSEIRNTGEAFVETELGGARYTGTIGARARVSADRIGNGPTLRFVPARRTIALYSLYGQGRFTLPDPRWRLTLGSTIEHNSFTGTEVQPTARLSYFPRGSWMGWLGLSHAVRTPSRIETDGVIPGPAGLTVLAGAPGYRSEDLDAFEAGWRWSQREDLTLELNGFVNRYRHLRSLEPGSGTVLFVNRNLLKADTQGAELTATWRPQPTMRFILGARLLNNSIELLPESRSPNPGTYEGNDARRVVTLQSSFDFARGLQLDAVLRHMSELPRPVVPAYTEGDLRLAWWIDRNWELALTGRNLLHPAHLEGVQGSAPAEFVRRTASLSLTWRN
jgi:iron complex outermembrane receptor protein